MGKAVSHIGNYLVVPNPVEPEVAILTILLPNSKVQALPCSCLKDKA